MKIILFTILLLVSLSAFTQDNRWIDLDWEEIPEAKEYEVELFQIQDDQVFSRGKFKTSNPNWSYAVAPGKYSLKIRSIDDRGVPGEWSEDIELKVKIVNPTMNRPAKGEKVIESLVGFEWSEVPDAISYQVIVRDANKAVLYDSSTSLNKENVYLKELGTYSFAVFAHGVGDEMRKINEIPENIFRSFERVGGELDAPEVKVNFSKQVVLEWKKIDNAEKFDVDVIQPQGAESKNLRFILHENNYIFPKEDLKDGITTIMIKALAPGYLDSPKTIVKIIKNDESVSTLEVISGKSATIKKTLTQLFWRHQFFYSLSFARFSYLSKNQQTDTSLEQSDLNGIGFNIDWLFQNRPQSFVHKFETSALRLTSGDQSGFQSRFSYNFILPFVTESKSWAFGLGASYLGLPSFFGDRTDDSVTSEQSSSIGPEVSLGIIDPLTPSWHLNANLAYAYHPIILSSPSGSADPFGWIRGQVRLLKYSTALRAFYVGAEYQRWTQNFGDNESSLNGWSGVLGIKQGW